MPPVKCELPFGGAQYIYHHFFTIKGDSGGALYRWFDSPGTNERRAYALGIVSRGMGCAIRDEAGVYSR